MDKKVLIEVCCGSVEDAIEAEANGADRVELNSSLFYGGLTPSLGTLIETKKRTNIPVMVMVRPRGGGFCYSDLELDIMIEDVKKFVEYGADGIVFGAINEKGEMNFEACKRIVEAIGDKEAVFHRAMDVVYDPIKTIDQLIETGS